MPLDYPDMDPFCPPVKMLEIHPCAYLYKEVELGNFSLHK